jgi:large subunit ribosomal protein L29
MTAQELGRKYAELKKDLFNLRMQHATNQLDNPIVIRDTKRDIARVLTAIREKEIAAAGGKEAANT